MDQVLVYLYWSWLIAAVAVIGFRVFGRATGKRSRVFEFRDRPEADPTADPTAAPATEPAPVPARAAPQPAMAAAPAVGALTQPAVSDEIHPAVLAAMRADQQPDQASEIPQSDGGLFTPESRSDHEPVSLGTLAPLHETLAGIHMPCDLVPVTELGPRSPRENHRERLVLMTTSAGAGEVAARLADELERLELDVTPIGPSTCVARRRDHAAEIRVHELPDRVIVDTQPAFPNVPDGGVVVEILSA